MGGGHDGKREVSKKNGVGHDQAEIRVHSVGVRHEPCQGGEKVTKVVWNKAVVTEKLMWDPK
jgi:hypothetical protein